MSSAIYPTVTPRFVQSPPPAAVVAEQYQYYEAMAKAAYEKVICEWDLNEVSKHEHEKEHFLLDLTRALIMHASTYKPATES